MSDARSYPARPYLAASAAIVRDGKILVVRRARPPAHGLFTLPGGVVEVGETLAQAVMREVSEETGMTIEPVALAGFRETIVRDAQTRVERHFVILCFAARWRGGEPVLNDELSEARWIDPAELANLSTTPGLAEIVAAAFDRLAGNIDRDDDVGAAAQLIERQRIGGAAVDQHALVDHDRPHHRGQRDRGGERRLERADVGI